MVFNQQHLEAFIESLTPQSQLNLCFQIFPILPSTNQTLWELINQGAAPGTVVIATQQTAGRGQWGHRWDSAVGGLYLSLALTPNLPTENSYQLTLSSAWGIATVLRSHGIPVFIKWPNDLILEGRKLGGILTETRVQQGKITKAVLGVGINWSNSVPETGINLQSFLEHHPIPSIPTLEVLAAIILQGLLSGYQYVSRKGIETLLSSYMELLINQGHRVVVNGQQGVIVGVTPRGELRVHLSASAEIAEICLKPGTISLGYGS